MSTHTREEHFVGGYHEERTEEPHAQKNLRYYQNSGVWDQYGVWGSYGGYPGGFYVGVTDGADSGGNSGAEGIGAI